MSSHDQNMPTDHYIEFYQNICRLTLIICSCPGSIFLYIRINLGGSGVVGTWVMRQLEKIL